MVIKSNTNQIDNVLMAQPIDPYFIITVVYDESVGGVGIEELNAENVELLKITDLMGRETVFTPNTPLLYIYSDGSVKNVMIIE